MNAFEDRKAQHGTERNLRKNPVPHSGLLDMNFTCDKYRRDCHSRIGLHSHTFRFLMSWCLTWCKSNVAWGRQMPIAYCRPNYCKDLRLPYSADSNFNFTDQTNIQMLMLYLTMHLDFSPWDYESKTTYVKSFSLVTDSYPPEFPRAFPISISITITFHAPCPLPFFWLRDSI